MLVTKNLVEKFFGRKKVLVKKSIIIWQKNFWLEIFLVKKNGQKTIYLNEIFNDKEMLVRPNLVNQNLVRKKIIL